MKDISKRASALTIGASALLVAAMLPLAAQAIVIDNGIPEGTEGHFSADVLTGGSTNVVRFTTRRANSTELVTPEVVFSYQAFVDPGNNGGGFILQGSQPMMQNGTVTSTGTFVGANGNTVTWRAVSDIFPNARFLFTTYEFTVTTPSIGPLRVFQYLDADIPGSGGDVFRKLEFTNGSLLDTLNNVGLFGVSQSGFIDNGTFAGGAADVFDNIRPRITGNGQTVSPGTTIQNLPAFNHPDLGGVFGPGDVVSVQAWDITPTVTSAFVESFLDGILISPPVDSDGDGVPDSADLCPGTPIATIVDPSGCPIFIPPPVEDSDGDGVLDFADLCPATPIGTFVDPFGCPIFIFPPIDFDADDDGVDDFDDLCPETPPGAPVDANGCSDAQRAQDEDGDGVADLNDRCPATSAGIPVDFFGCPLPDSDQDGLLRDNCPSAFNPDQLDTDGDGAGDVCDSEPNGPAASILNANNVRCNRRRCDVRLECNSTTACNNTADIVVSRRFLRTSGLQRDGLKAPLVTMAAGVSNTPAGAAGPIVMRLNREGKRVFRANRGRSVEAIMRIAGANGRELSQTRIRLRIR